MLSVKESFGRGRVHLSIHLLCTCVCVHVYVCLCMLVFGCIYYVREYIIVRVVLYIYNMVAMALTVDMFLLLPFVV